MIGRRGFVAGLSAFTASPALAQEVAPAPAAPAAAPTPPAVPPRPVKLGYGDAPPLAPGVVRVVIHSAEGEIIVDLYQDKAPITVGNFLRYVDAKRYDGSTFFRASRPANMIDYGIVQAGQDAKAARYPPIKLEPTSLTGLKHGDGTLSMGRLAPDSATSDYFICVGNASYLNADPTQAGDNQGFAAFGQVVQGMAVVRKILIMPRSATKGEGVMLGEYLDPPVPITAVRRV